MEGPGAAGFDRPDRFFDVGKIDIPKTVLRGKLIPNRAAQLGARGAVLLLGNELGGPRYRRIEPWKEGPQRGQRFADGVAAESALRVRRVHRVGQGPRMAICSQRLRRYSNERPCEVEPRGQGTPAAHTAQTLRTGAAQ
jgi:hypothetical protein